MDGSFSMPTSLCSHQPTDHNKKGTKDSEHPLWQCPMGSTSLNNSWKLWVFESLCPNSVAGGAVLPYHPDILAEVTLTKRLWPLQGRVQEPGQKNGRRSSFFQDKDDSDATAAARKHKAAYSKKAFLSPIAHWEKAIMREREQ